MENFENLKPMSRLKFQILYSRCAQSGWVDGEFSETLYQKYLLRYSYFLDYLQKLRKLNFKFFIEIKDSNIIYLVDDSGLLHPVLLNSRISEGINSNINNIDNKVGLLNKLLQNFGLLIDLFPFPIKRDTAIRKLITNVGYTFREHLISYFLPFIKEIKKFLGDKKVTFYLAESPNEDDDSTYIYNSSNSVISSYLSWPANNETKENQESFTYIICPPYVGAHVYLEFTYGLKLFKDVFKFKSDSNYAFKNDNEINCFIEKYIEFNGADIKDRKSIIGISAENHEVYFNEDLKQNIEKSLWLNGSNNPGQKNNIKL